MTQRYMLDTNTCIRAMRAEATSKLAGKFNRHADQLCTSIIIRAELRFDAENSSYVDHNLLEFERFTARLQAILDYDADAATAYGRVRLATKAQPIGPLDTLIAAHAASRDLILVTGNLGEFARVPGLRIEDWAQ